MATTQTDSQTDNVFSGVFNLKFVLWCVISFLLVFVAPLMLARAGIASPKFDFLLGGLFVLSLQCALRAGDKRRS